MSLELLGDVLRQDVAQQLIGLPFLVIEREARFLERRHLAAELELGDRLARQPTQHLLLFGGDFARLVVEDA